MDQKTKRDIESAGAWFVGAYSKELYNQFQKINNEPSYKKGLIQTIFTDTGRDSKLGGTTVRVNAVLRIIARGEISDALRYVVNSRISFGSDASFIQKAQDFLEEISR